MTRRAKYAIGAAAVVAVIALVGFGIPAWRWWSNQHFYDTPQGRAGDPPVMITVDEGLALGDVARLLEREHVVGPAARFIAIARLRHREKDLQPGEYRFDRPIAPRRVLEILGRGSRDVAKVTIPEGLGIGETAAVVARAGVGDERSLERAFSDASPVRALDPAATDLEGYLLPGTYRFSKGVPPERVAAALVRAFTRRFATPEAERIARAGRPLREIVTIASMVEKETARPEERARIAGVFLARLSRGMKLQCDPTVIYAMRRRGLYHGDLRRADLERDDPYNTYARAGLPPGPIASPGIASLEAVLAPERGEALYFVARGDGSHVFSASLDVHNTNVRRFQKHHQ